MCGPALVPALVAAGLSAGGNIVNGMESSATQANQIRARNAATEAELARNKGYQATATGQFDPLLAKFSPGAQSDALVSGQQGVAQAFNANLPTNFGSVGTGHGPAIAGVDEQKRLADAFARSKANADTLANVTGYGKAMDENNRSIVDTGRNLDTTANFARQSAAVGTKEADAAYNNAFKTNSGFGDLLNLAGTLVGAARAPGSSLFAQPASRVVTGAPISLLPG